MLAGLLPGYGLTAMLLTIAVGMIVLGLFLWLRECGIMPLRGLIGRKTYLERLLLLTFVCGLVHYGSTKGFLGVVDDSNPTIGNAPEDNPEGPGGFYVLFWGKLYRREWRWDFKFEARCKKGPYAGRTVSTAQKFYYAEGHWEGNDFAGYFYDKQK